ncbi:hypothetical protein GJ496_011414 [Pomphorhynchus laevis]|nr:hypothetical protein GJ496_011414 [Pomphorhynchus laevis]
MAFTSKMLLSFQRFPIFKLPSVIQWTRLLSTDENNDNHIISQLENYTSLDSNEKRTRLKNVLRRISAQRENACKSRERNTQTVDDVLDWVKLGAKELDPEYRISLIEDDALSNDYFNDSYELYQPNEPEYTSVLKSGQPLNIFNNDKSPGEKYEQLAFWKAFDEYKIDILNKTKPNNSWEELIELTNEGKIWHFPINNEQGVDNDKLDSFDEHLLFNENELIQNDPWISKNSVVKELLELLILGLSRNHYMTVSEKQNHFNWFIDYLKSKRETFDAISQ